METVALQAGLESFRRPLEESGLKVVELETAKEPVDVIVYSGVSCEPAGISGLEEIGSLTGGTGHAPVLMLNAVGLTPEEVRDLVLSRRG